MFVTPALGGLRQEDHKVQDQPVPQSVTLSPKTATKKDKKRNQQNPSLNKKRVVSKQCILGVPDSLGILYKEGEKERSKDG